MKLTVKTTFFLVIAMLALPNLWGNATTKFPKYVTPYELSSNTNTATYEECRDWYRTIQTAFPDIAYFDSMGTGDEGFPIYTFRLYTGENANPVKMLIMNNIHPGEPEGTDASMLLVREILMNTDGKWNNVRKNIDLNIICQYNTDGTKNRSCCSRANQNGPLEMGFRGNARNLDLNRDFVKCDSRNAWAFSNYFSKNKFHVFVDNHTSNGADYQYTLTWFHTRPEKLDPLLVPGLAELSSAVKESLNKRNIPTAPYVETYKAVPDSGIVAFWESPRYSTGYAALHHCMGFTVETHMWKPFADRVSVTLAFLEEMAKTCAENERSASIVKAYKAVCDPSKIQPNTKEFIQWQLNSKRADTILFLGYEYSYPIHPLTGLPLLKYNRQKPWDKKIPYYNFYTPVDSVILPRMYIIPSAWTEVLQRLRLNQIELRTIPHDSLWPVRASFVVSYESTKTPYEGHYLHYNTHVRDTVVPVPVYAGDVYVLVTEANKKFLAAVLEPQSADSYFNWGFFDAVLQQKEWFSDYVWADKALEILNSNPKLKMEFEKEKERDPQFSSSNQAQLAWVYYHSEYYEASHKRIPVYRVD